MGHRSSFFGHRVGLMRQDDGWLVVPSRHFDIEKARSPGLLACEQYVPPVKGPSALAGHQCLPQWSVAQVLGRHPLPSTGMNARQRFRTRG